MPSSAQAISAFIQRLNFDDLAWLESRKFHAQNHPPQDWLRLYADGVFLGWISPERVDQIIAGLPHCAIVHGHLHWSSPFQNSLHRSRELQNFLKSQASKSRISGWRNEFFCFWEEPACPPDPSDPPFFCVERAGFRHLGMMSHAVHINGFLHNGDLWCGRRAHNKATDPGMLDNLAAGGLPTGETAMTTAIRELQEEAGIDAVHAELFWAGAIRIQRLSSQGWHDEKLLIYNLTLPEARLPANKDGEVQEFLRLTPRETVMRMQAGEFTDDACLALAGGLGF